MSKIISISNHPLSIEAIFPTCTSNSNCYDDE